MTDTVTLMTITLRARESTTSTVLRLLRFRFSHAIEATVTLCVFLFTKSLSPVYSLYLTASTGDIFLMTLHGFIHPALTVSHEKTALAANIRISATASLSPALKLLIIYGTRTIEIRYPRISPIGIAITLSIAACLTMIRLSCLFVVPTVLSSP